MFRVAGTDSGLPKVVMAAWLLGGREDRNEPGEQRAEEHSTEVRRGPDRDVDAHRVWIGEARADLSQGAANGPIGECLRHSP